MELSSSCSCSTIHYLILQWIRQPTTVQRPKTQRPKKQTKAVICCVVNFFLWGTCFWMYQSRSSVSALWPLCVSIPKSSHFFFTQLHISASIRSLIVWFHLWPFPSFQPSCLPFLSTPPHSLSSPPFSSMVSPFSLQLSLALCHLAPITWTYQQPRPSSPSHSSPWLSLLPRWLGQGSLSPDKGCWGEEEGEHGGGPATNPI